MNKQDEEKILEIAQLCNDNYEECKTCRQLECDNRGKYVGALEMAQWKESQMIEKVCDWLKDCSTYTNMNCNICLDKDLYNKLVKDFKKAVEEES